MVRATVVTHRIVDREERANSCTGSASETTSTPSSASCSPKLVLLFTGELLLQSDFKRYPQRDTRRRTYNLKEQKLAKAIVDALDLPKSSSAANKLNNWKTPTKEDVRPVAPAKQSLR